MYCLDKPNLIGENQSDLLESSKIMIITGHRGAANLVAENTLLSMQTAIDLGVDQIETDVHLT